MEDAWCFSQELLPFTLQIQALPLLSIVPAPGTRSCGEEEEGGGGGRKGSLAPSLTKSISVLPQHLHSQHAGVRPEQEALQ